MPAAASWARDTVSPERGGGITVINDAAASITGQSGSAVNIDNDSNLENMVTVINRGTS